ncbi:MAG: L,D-transpeptidase family protein, partial [Limosilactobacillus fermentum]|nr:L,D-transpeptidase family protein [Limosilactobacillus fermentum]
ATILLSAKKTNYKLTPSELDTSQLSAMKKAIKVAVDKLNQNRVMAVDAKAVWKDNKVTVTSPKKGTAYDTSKIQAELSNQLAADSIQLTAKVKTPLTKNSAAVKNEVAALKKLSNKKITYKVENKSYTLTSDDIITKATYQNGQYQFDTAALDQEIAKINKAQSTLGKSFKFNTHAGNTITTSAQGSYGWRISTTKATKTLTDALLKGTTSVSAKADVYGIGYNTGGVGYGTTSNNGIGDTYAEVSISAQTAWFYKDSKLVYSARVVTGKQSSGDDTPTGVYYIMYKQRNTTLRGIGDTGKAYASPVSYWAPFTESGCGFHDASWRTNWSTTAYVNNGSNGCVNMHTYDAPNAFNDLSVDEPVVIY